MLANRITLFGLGFCFCFFRLFHWFICQRRSLGSDGGKLRHSHKRGPGSAKADSVPPLNWPQRLIPCFQSGLATTELHWAWRITCQPSSLVLFPYHLQNAVPPKIEFPFS